MRPLPLISAVTVSTRVSPVLSSVAMTLSPPLTFSIGSVVPSDISTFVPGTKLLVSHDALPPALPSPPLPLLPPLEREEAPVEPPLPELPPEAAVFLPAPEAAAAEECGAAEAWADLCLLLPVLRTAWEARLLVVCFFWAAAFFLAWAAFLRASSRFFFSFFALLMAALALSISFFALSLALRQALSAENACLTAL